MDGLKTILVHQQDGDRWLCPDCDLENHMENNTCEWCGCARTSYSEIAEPWNRGQTIDDEQTISTADNNVGKIVAWIFLAIILLVFIALALQNQPSNDLYFTFN